MKKIICCLALVLGACEGARDVATDQAALTTDYGAAIATSKRTEAGIEAELRAGGAVAGKLTWSAGAIEWTVGEQRGGISTYELAPTLEEANGFLYASWLEQARTEEAYGWFVCLFSNVKCCLSGDGQPSQAGWREAAFRACLHDLAY